MNKMTTVMKAVFISLLSTCAIMTSAVADEAYFYTVKGIIKGMPGDRLAKNELLVKHQPIPGYRDDTGAIVGMMAMTMPFYLKEGVSLEGIKEGDSVELKVEQHLKPKFTEEVISVAKAE
jgi:Cu/Ag efflux protein CusF